MEPTSTRPIRKVKLADLKPHPRQAEFFPAPTSAAILALAEDIEARGLQQPIEILADKTIVCGHDRVAAVKVLDWDEIDAIIRDDLGEVGDVAVEEHMIRDNFARKQLSPLGRARCAKRLRDLEPQHRNSSAATSHPKPPSGRLRDEIGKSLNLKGREVARLLRLREAPREFQEACEEGKLSLVMVGHVAALRPEVQHAIAKALRNGAKPREIVGAYLRHAKGQEVGLDPVVRRLLAEVAKGVRGFGGRVVECRIDPRHVVDVLMTVQDGVDLLGDLKGQILRAAAASGFDLAGANEDSENDCDDGPP